jgi:hypothetical protein
LRRKAFRNAAQSRAGVGENNSYQREGTMPFLSNNKVAVSALAEQT